MSDNLKNGLMILSGVAVGIVILIYIVANMDSAPVAGPCSPEGYPGRCYIVQEEVCETVWNKAKTDCEEIVKKLSLPPGRLTHPIVTKCQIHQLDKAFAYNRVTNPECDQMHVEVSEWAKRNLGP